MIRMLLIFVCLSLSVFATSPLCIGIAGGTGSGKTTLAENIHRMFPGSVLICQDSYYRDLSHVPFEEREKVNFDHPDSLEFSLLKKHLIDLKNGQAIEQPIYNFHLHAREKNTAWIEPAQIILVEGILLLAAPEVRDLLDIKIFVDTDDDIRMLRRMERDRNERSRDFDNIKEQYLTTVKPMHDAFVAPSKKYADVIFPEGGYNQVAIDLILAKISETLYSKESFGAEGLENSHIGVLNMSGHVFVVSEWLPKENCEEELWKFFKQLLALTLEKEKGCIRAHVTRQIPHPGSPGKSKYKIILLQEYVDIQAYDIHCNAPYVIEAFKKYVENEKTAIVQDWSCRLFSEDDPNPDI